MTLLKLPDDPTIDCAPLLTAALASDNADVEVRGPHSIRARVWALNRRNIKLWGDAVFTVIGPADPTKTGTPYDLSTEWYLGRSNRKHFTFKLCSGEIDGIQVVGQNIPARFDGRFEFEHAFDFQSSSMKLKNAGARYVFGDGFELGDGVYVGEGGPCIDSVVDNFRAGPVGRQGGAVTHATNTKITRYRSVDGTARSGLDIEPIGEGVVDGIEVAYCAIQNTNLLGITSGGAGMVKNLWLHHNRLRVTGIPVLFFRSSVKTFQRGAHRVTDNTYTVGSSTEPGLRANRLESLEFSRNTVVCNGQGVAIISAVQHTDAQDNVFYNAGGALTIPGAPGYKTPFLHRDSYVNPGQLVEVNNQYLAYTPEAQAKVKAFLDEWLAPPYKHPALYDMPLDLNTASFLMIADLPADKRGRRLGLKRAALIQALAPNIRTLDDLEPLPLISRGVINAIRASNRTLQR